MAVGQVDGAGDSLQLAVLHPFGNAFQHPFGADHERQLGDHDGLLARRHVLEMRHRPRGECAAAGLVRFADAVSPDDDAATRPIGARHVAHELLQRGVGMRHQVLRGRDDLAEIVGRHVRGHADSDARTAVDQQVGDRGRQHGRLLELVVVVRREIAMAVHQRETHRERLRETHHRLVDGRIAVGVELAHHLAHHAGRFHVRAVGRQVHLAHLVDDAALHGLEAVARVRQGSRVDHRIRVFEERLAHFLVQRRFHDMLLDLTRVIGLMSRGAMCHRCHSPICASAIRMARMAEMVPLKNPIVHDSEQSCQESRPAVSFSDGRCLNGKHER